MVYFRKLIRGLDPLAITGASSLGTDNKGARDTSYNPEHHSRMKHVERRHFYVLQPRLDADNGRTLAQFLAKHYQSLVERYPRQTYQLCASQFCCTDQPSNDPRRGAMYASYLGLKTDTSAVHAPPL